MSDDSYEVKPRHRLTEWERDIFEAGCLQGASSERDIIVDWLRRRGATATAELIEFGMYLEDGEK